MSFSCAHIKIQPRYNCVRGNEGGEKENKNASEEIRWKTPAEKHAMTNKGRQTVEKKKVTEKHTACIVCGTAF